MSTFLKALYPNPAVMYMLVQEKWLRWLCPQARNICFVMTRGCTRHNAQILHSLPHFSWSDRAAGADLCLWRAQASLARREPTPLPPRTIQDQEVFVQLSSQELPSESEWLLLHQGQWQRKVSINHLCYSAHAKYNGQVAWASVQQLHECSADQPAAMSDCSRAYWVPEEAFG